MAIGPEQLDIKKLAKIFLLKGDLASNIDKDIIRVVLESFTEEDWNNIRDKIFGSRTQGIKELRAAIEKCQDFLNTMSNNLGINVFERYTSDSVKILESAIAIAENIAANAYSNESMTDGQEELKLKCTANSLLILLEKMYLSYNDIEDGQIYEITETFTNENFEDEIRVVDNVFASYTKVSSKEYNWSPAKILKASFVSRNKKEEVYSDAVNIFVSLDERLRDVINPAYHFVKGLYLRDEKEKRSFIITSEDVSFNTEDGDIVILENGYLTLKNKNIEIIKGYINQEKGIIFIDRTNLRLVNLVSNYLQKPFNVVPCWFQPKMGSDESSKLFYDNNLDNVMRYVLGDFEGLDKNDEIINELGVLNGSFIQKDENKNFKSLLLSAKTNTELEENKLIKIMIDNDRKIIMGIPLTFSDLSEVVFCSDGYELYNDGEIVTSVNGTRTVKVCKFQENNENNTESINEEVEDENANNIVAEYRVMEDLYFIDRQENQHEINGRVYSSQPPVNKNGLAWIPSTLFKNYFITVEPIANTYDIYAKNTGLETILGFVIGDTLYTRHDRKKLLIEGIIKCETVEDYMIMYPGMDITDEVLQELKLTQEIDNLSRPFHFKEAAYYNGHFFSSENIFEDENVINFIKHIEKCKDIADDEVSKYIENAREENPLFVLTDELLKEYEKEAYSTLWVPSEFKPVSLPAEDGSYYPTDDFYWEGSEKDYILLPNTKKECKDYLNIVAFKTKPEENKEQVVLPSNYRK